MKKLLLTAAFLFSCSLAFTQTHLSGVVTDDKGEPLIAATVKLMKDNNLVRSIFTDADGNYAFQALAPGVYNVEISYTGYQTSRTDGVVVKADNLNKLDASLGESVLHGCGIITYCYPMLDQNPGNTRAEFTSNFIRNMY